ncbi:MAG: Chromate resistance protein ChrB [Dehalococcoidia bacterium]
MPTCYNRSVSDDRRWVLLAYRLPREPSTPRIALWRKLRQLGAIPLLDNLAALPLTDQTREQMDWLAEGVIEAGGDASVWLAEPAAVAHRRALEAEARAARSEEYRSVLARPPALTTSSCRRPSSHAQRLRRDLGDRIRARDHFGAPEQTRPRRPRSPRGPPRRRWGDEGYPRRCAMSIAGGAGAWLDPSLSIDSALYFCLSLTSTTFRRTPPRSTCAAWHCPHHGDQLGVRPSAVRTTDSGARAHRLHGA